MDQGLKEFMENKPDAAQLRKQYPGIEHLLSGEFARDTPNLYPKDNPVVGSWELNQGRDKNPTYGMFSQQEEPHVFPTGDYIETLVILGGRFKTENEISIIEGDHPMITAKDVLKLTALTDVIYLCMYSPKR